MVRKLKNTNKKYRKQNRKTRRNRRKVKKGGMPPPIQDAATYSYPPYFPNKGPEGKDIWPVKFTAPNVKDVNVPEYKQFPLGENVIVDIQEQEGVQTSLKKNQTGGYVYPLKKMYSKNRFQRQYKQLKGLPKIGRK